MIKDFVPARTSLASGIVIKQTLLERNRYPEPQASWSNLDISGTIKSTQVWDPISQSSYISHSLIEEFNGGTAGMFEPFNYISNTSQSWNETYPTISGSVTILHDSQDEFYNGEFPNNIPVSLKEICGAFFGQDDVPDYYFFINWFNNSNFPEQNFLTSSNLPLSYNILAKTYLSVFKHLSVIIIASGFFSIVFFNKLNLDIYAIIWKANEYFS
jgi:hypothetical protein